MSPHWSATLTLLALILLANGLPALLRLLIGPARPLDGGRVWVDGRPLLGPSKTWRGLGVALAGTTLAGLALGLHWTLGLKVALGAMVGDLMVSFLKRRRGHRPSASVPLLDQVPEALIPGLLAKAELGLGWWDLAVLVLAFVLLDLILTDLAKRLLRASGRFRRS
jgi:CDP-2,3-bis-(O-geranylgeranyl)-sn-glycerol synthase